MKSTSEASGLRTLLKHSSGELVLYVTVYSLFLLQLTFLHWLPNVARAGCLRYTDCTLYIM